MEGASGKTTGVITINRIVRYVLTDRDAEQINRRRTYGAQAHIGNLAIAGQVFPAMVVAARPLDICSMQVFLDGNDVFWAEDRLIAVGDHPELEFGTWHWPPKSG